MVTYINIVVILDQFYWYDCATCPIDHWEKFVQSCWDLYTNSMAIEDTCKYLWLARDLHVNRSLKSHAKLLPKFVYKFNRLLKIHAKSLPKFVIG